MRSERVVGQTVQQVEGHMLDPRSSCCCVSEEDNKALSCFGFSDQSTNVGSPNRTSLSCHFDIARWSHLMRTRMCQLFQQSQGLLWHHLTNHYCQLVMSSSCPPGPMCVGVFSSCFCFVVCTSLKTAWCSPLGYTVQTLKCLTLHLQKQDTV